MLLDGELGHIVENSEEGIYQGMKQALAYPESFEIYQERLQDYEMPFTLENAVKSIINIIDEL